MRCLQCGKRVSLLRKLTDGEFCSDEHRQSFQQQQNDLALARLIEAQRGMSRPTRTAAAKAKVATVAENEPIPPFGSFQQLTLMGIRLRLLHSPNLELLSAAYPVLVPFHEFHTLIMGMPGAETVAWSGATAKRLQADVLGQVEPTRPGCHEPRRPAARLMLQALPAAEPEMTTESLPASESLPEPAPIIDPPWAELMSVSQTTTAIGGLVLKQAQTPAPAFARQPMRWVPVRGESDIAPAPEAGLLPVEVRVATTAPAARANVASLLALTGVPVVALAPDTSGLVLTENPCLGLDGAVHRIPAGAPMAPTAHARFDLPASDVWPRRAGLLPAASLSLERSNVGWQADGNLQSLPHPAVLRILQEVLSTATPATSTSNTALPAALLRADEFDFWSWLERQTAPPEEAAAEIEPSFAGLAGLNLPELAIAGAPTWVPLAIRLAQAPSPAPAYSAVPTRFDGSTFWAILDRLTSEQAPSTNEPEILPETATALEAPTLLESAEPIAAAAEDFSEEPAPPLFTRLQPILAWRLCEPPPTEIRTSASSKDTIWQQQIGMPPARPRLSLRPDNAESAAGDYKPTRNNQKSERRSLRSRFALPSSWKVWQHAPADLKWVAVALPMILALVLYSFRGAQPKEQAGAKLASSQSQSILGTQFASLQKVIMQRAAIHLLDDFRSGLSAWEGKAGWAKSWKYGEATFLEPGQLAVYKPTVPMKDYTLEFLGQIERQGMSWVVRADDKLRNYHVLRLVITRPGPMPEAAMVRYSVTDGKEGPVTSLPLPFPIKMSTMYRVRVEVRGKEITTYLQGQVVDSFSDTRLRAGGVGFFSARGERALLRWVEVTHQYDYLGRFCALLAPYDVQAGGERAD